jgi:hypothetical protein
MYTVEARALEAEAEDKAWTLKAIKTRTLKTKAKDNRTFFSSRIFEAKAFPRILHHCL